MVACTIYIYKYLLLNYYNFQIFYDYLHTFISPFNSWIKALHTSSTHLETVYGENLKRYDKLLKLSPQAKKRSVTASLSFIGIHSRMFVLFFEMYGPILFNMYSKSTELILQKFSNFRDGSTFKSCNIFVALYLNIYIYISNYNNK